MQIVGTRGFKGKKTMNARTQFNALFTFEEDDEPETDPDDLDTDQLTALENTQ
jgi:hypothetical protein